MRRMAVINQKGGVGKTTTTANLGAALARSGSRVLLIDLDPQGHLSLHFGSEPAPGTPSVYDVLTDSLPIRDALIDAGDNIALLPADIDLAGAESELSSVTGREVLLREAIEPVKDDFDYLLIDCPPSLGVLTVNALVAANEVLIPLQAHFLALQGLSRLLGRTVTLVRQRINPMLRVEGVVLCMHEPATRLAGEVVDDLTRFLEAARGTNVAWADAKLYETCIRRNIKLAESSSFGQTVFDYAPRSNGAIDYARLAREIFAPRSILEPEAHHGRPIVSAPPAAPASPPDAGPPPSPTSVAPVGASVDEKKGVPGDEPQPLESQMPPSIVPPAPVETGSIEPAPAPTATAFVTIGSGAPTPIQVAEKVEGSARVPVDAPRAPVPSADPPEVIDRSSLPVPTYIERPPAESLPQDDVAQPARSDDTLAPTPVPGDTSDQPPVSDDASKRQPSSAPSAVAAAP